MDLRALAVGTRAGSRPAFRGEAVGAALLVVGTMLTMGKHAVQVARVVARAIVAAASDLVEQARVLAVLLGLVVLLPILDQPALPPQGRSRSIARSAGLRRRFRGRGLELLDDARLCLRAVLAFCAR